MDVMIHTKHTMQHHLKHLNKNIPHTLTWSDTGTVASQTDCHQVSTSLHGKQE